MMLQSAPVAPPVASAATPVARSRPVAAVPAHTAMMTGVKTPHGLERLCAFYCESVLSAPSFNFILF